MKSRITPKLPKIDRPCPTCLGLGWNNLQKFSIDNKQYSLESQTCTRCDGKKWV